MDMLNKLKSTVGGLIGNPVTREYEIIKHVGSGGPGCLWKIYHGIKRSTKQEAGVFVFEKKLLEKYPRKDRDAILDLLRKGCTQLTRLRHPCLLTVQHPLEESRESLAFATEPVFTSLANLLGQRDNMPSPPPPDVSEHKLFEVEIKYGFLQLTDALKFLHNDVHMIHGNVIPGSIILNSNGAWKLAGFDFVIPSSTTPDQPASFPMRELSSHVASVLQPDLNYLAPEHVLTHSCDTASDMFSLGLLMYTVLNEGKLLYDSNENLTTFKQNCEQLRCLNMSLLGSLPDGLKEYVKMLLSSTPTVRPDADQLSKIPFFDDVGAMTLQYMDALFQQDNQQKAQFFKGLPKVISKLPKRVVMQRVLPCLCKEFINPDMVPFVLPNVLHIAEQCTDPEYVKLVLPSLKGVFKLQEPVQVLLICMQRMNLLLTKTPSDDIQNHVLPMVYRALESSSTQIQELCLTILPSFAGMIEYTSIKHSIVPRIKKLCLETSLLSIRVGCLVSVGKMLDHMDKWFVLDEVLPLLLQIPSREPAVLMAILGIIKVTMTHKKLGITKEMAATKVLPFLFPLSIDNNLNLKQFNSYMSVIRDLIGLVEKEQKTKLEQLNNLQEEQRTTIEFAQKLQESQNGGVHSSVGRDNQTSGGADVDQTFQSFGLDDFMGQSSKKTSAANQSPASKSTMEPAGIGGITSKSSGTSPVVRPSQVSLSLEEKQRLQKEQEFQQRLKTQKPILPAEAKKQPPKQQPKDLSNSLLDSNIMSFSSTSSRTSVNASPGAGVNMSMSGSSSGMGSGPVLGLKGAPSNATNWSSSAPSGSVGATMSNASLLSQSGMPVTSGGMTAQFPPTNLGQPQAKKNIDMSSLDSLLGPSQSQKSRLTMNQMSAAPSMTAGPSQGQRSYGNVPHQQGMMGTYQGTVGGQFNWQTSSKSSPSLQQSQVNRTGGDFDPFGGTKSANMSNTTQQKSDNLLDFLG